MTDKADDKKPAPPKSKPLPLGGTYRGYDPNVPQTRRGKARPYVADGTMTGLGDDEDGDE